MIKEKTIKEWIKIAMKEVNQMKSEQKKLDRKLQKFHKNGKEPMLNMHEFTLGDRLFLKQNELVILESVLYG